MPGVDYLMPTTVTAVDMLSGPRLRTSETSQGTMLVHDKQIFRVGTFKDSTGTERTWTAEDLDNIVVNFYALRANKALAGVPLRIDHSWSARDMVGWIADIRRYGDVLFADLHFTEWDAYWKWERGTYEPVSSEIAPYESNDGTVYNPTLIGVAFVDIPAVEGLFRAAGVNAPRVTAVPIDTPVLDSNSGTVYESGQKERTMTTITPGIHPDLAKMSTADLVARSAAHSAAATDPAVVALTPEGRTALDALVAAGLDSAGITALHSAVNQPPASTGDEDPLAGTGLEGLSEEEITALAAADAELLTAWVEALANPPANPPATPPEGVSVHGSPVGNAFTFRVNGTQVTDLAVVQAHIDALEQFRSTTVESERRDFVAGLVRDNKVMAHQAQGLTDMALSLTPEQFGVFKETYSAAGTAPLLGSYGREAAGPGAPAGAAPPQVAAIQSEIATCEEIIATHRRAGKSEDFIKGTSTYAKLTTLTAQLG